MTLDEYKKFKNATMASSAIEDYRKYKANVLSNTNRQQQSSTLVTPETIAEPLQPTSNSGNKVGKAIGSFWNSGIGKAINTVPAALAQLGVGVAQGVEGTVDFISSIAANGEQLEAGIWQKAIDKTKNDIAEEEKRNPNADLSFQKNVTDMIQKYVDMKNNNTDKITNLIQKQWIQDSIGKPADEFTREYSYLPVTAGQVVRTVGNMLPAIGGGGAVASKLPQAATTLGKVGTKAATMLPFMAQAAGSSTEQALNEGADLADATKYGLASGAIEGAIESISGGIGGSIGGKLVSSKLGKEAIERITKNALGKFALRLADAGIDVAGEGFEEVLSTAINPLLQRMTYDEKAELATNEEMMQSFIDGALASLLVKGGQAGLSRVANRNNANIQENEVQNQVQTQNIEQPNVTLPIQAKMAQNTNMEQITQVPNLPTQKAQETLQSAKIAGMTDMDMQKAIDLNNMLRSGANLEFYDAKNIPENVQADKAKVANGFYKDGTLWINKNSKNKVEQILGHELTHHLETTNSYTDLSNTILDSEVFYDFIAEKGYTNVAEYKTKLKEMGYTDAQMNNEMVARFVEEKMFTDQASIDRLARQNTKLVEKIKNWISDLVVSFKGTSQEKELRRIENMYRKALEQARNTTTSTETQYSYAGELGLNNLKNNRKYMNSAQRSFVNELQNNYEKATYLSKTGASNEQILKETGWFKSDGKWRWEIPDTLMTLKEDIQLEDGVSYDLADILEHDLLFMVYPELMKQQVIVDNGLKGKGKYSTVTKDIKLKVAGRSNGNIELTLLHEVQHAIQDKEGFEGGTSPLGGMLRYYEHKGEIEAADTTRRFLEERKAMKEGRTFDREKVAPELSKENPIHPGLNKYLASDKQTKIRDNIYKWSKGGANYESESFDVEDIELEDNETNNETLGQNNSRRRIAGKEPAFSMPETDNQGRKLSKEQQEFFKDSKVRDENGKLQVVYHGTGENFTVFSDKFMGKNNGNALGQGYYFSSSRFIANSYKGTSNGKLMEVYLNIQKPFDFFGEGDLLDKAEYLKNKYGISQIEGKLKFNLHALGLIKSIASENNITTSEILQDLGYDGIISGNEYIAFEPNQIKNVDNTNPTENPDIRYSMNPVNIAKTPPNIETGLDQLKRTSRVKEGDTQSSFTKNIYNQSIFDEKFKDLALDDKNIQSYERISNKETLQQANDAINEQGQKWVDRFLDKPNGELKATDIAGGFILMNRYQQVGDYESMIRVAEKLRKAGTQQGQTIQMFSVLGRMTPEGMTYYAQKELNKAYDEILKNKTQKWADEHADEFKLNEKDIEYIQRRVNQAARLPEGRDKYVLLGEIASRIQNKIPPQAGQGLKALARNSMLLNPKTMVRNILGNVVIVPNHIISDFVGSGIDKAISKKTGIRTTGGFDVKALQGAKKGVYESFDDFRRQISTREMGGDRFEIGQGKNFYENHTGRFAETRNKINKALNGLDRVTGFLLETGDRPFYETWFMNSLNNQMKLNNVTEPTAEMIEIATDEALQRTWQDNNTYTKFVNSIRKGMNNLNVKGYGLGDIVMPFVKTPANLTKAVVDFSPLGAINAAIKTSQFNKDIGKGIATTKQQREVVKAWSQVITGTLGMAIMAGLANAGILGGGSEEDKDVRAFEQNVLGIKPYSIKIGDKTYTYDWAQPLGTSAAMVADTVKSLKNAKDTEGKVAAILEGAQSGASVLLEQSFVSGIRNLFEEDNLINALIETGLNEPSKFTPQFLSQLAQIQDDTARTSYVYNNPLKTAENKIKAKIPGLRETLEPSVDVLGREVKTDNSIGNVMFNPTNTAMARTTEGAEEMYRVYKATGEKSAIAQVAPYYFNVGSEKIVLTPKQRTQYQKTTGKIASDGVENLIDNKAYKNLPDAEKAEILSELYSYGNAVAKEETTTKYLMPKDMQKIKDSGMKPEEYILAKRIANNGGTKKEELYDALISAGYSKKQTESFLSYYKGYKFDSTTNKNKLPTLSSQIAKLPTLKK